MKPPISDLPFADHIERGVVDLNAGRFSIDALLICVALDRLRALGLDVPADVELSDDAELLLYEALRASDVPDAYYMYNSLLRGLDSFMNALDARRAREASKKIA